jgi:flagellar M-ring protein FliF
MQAFLEGLKRLGAALLAALAVAGVGTIAVLSLLIMSGSSPRMALLYATRICVIPARWWISSAAPIPYALAAGGAQILVPADQVPQARVLLAQQGLPSGGTVGYEIFDHTSGLGETDFQQRTDKTRALERELARTIEAIRGVRLERVHVVLLQRAPFARTQDTVQASVTADDDGGCAAELRKACRRS